MRHDETQDHKRIVPESVEFRVREAEDDGQDGSRNVAEQERPEGGDGPVLATADDDV